MKIAELRKIILSLFYSNWLLVAIFALDVAILLLHLFKVSFIAVDNYTILLLIILILVPLSQQIKRLRWGEFEAEMETKVTKSSEKVAEQLSKKITSSKNPKVVEENKDLIQAKIDDFFKLGLKIGGYFKNRPYYQINNVRIYKDAKGRETVVWDEQ